MKKIVLSVLFVFTFTAYVLHQRGEEENIHVTAPGNANIVSQQVVSPSPSVVAAQFKDGEYTGDVVDAYYGNVQVSVVIKNGKISNVQFLEYPNDRRTSVQINTQAMPYLRQEAIQIQNANVDIVSGATQTSQAFRESLKSALVKAI